MEEWSVASPKRPEEQRTGIRMATVAVQSGLQLYLKQINESPLLTAVQEKELARRIIQNNDPEAREIMVRSNLRLVVNLAKHYINRGLSLPDLIEEGNIGLLKPVEGDNIRHLLDLLDSIDEREATILRLRYGLDGEDPMTLKQIGERIGLTRERVRQIEHEALSKLRDSMLVKG